MKDLADTTDPLPLCVCTSFYQARWGHFKDCPAQAAYSALQDQYNGKLNDMSETIILQKSEIADLREQLRLRDWTYWGMSDDFNT